MKTAYELRVETLKAFEDNQFTYGDIEAFMRRLERDCLRSRGMSPFVIRAPSAHYSHEGAPGMALRHGRQLAGGG